MYSHKKTQLLATRAVYFTALDFFLSALSSLEFSQTDVFVVAIHLSLSCSLALLCACSVGFSPPCCLLRRPPPPPPPFIYSYLVYPSALCFFAPLARNTFPVCAK